MTSAPEATIGTMPSPPDVDRIYLGESKRHVCDGCDRWAEMERLGDARGWERIDAPAGQVGWAAIKPPALDPPLQPTLYRCPSCGHEHEGAPALDTPT